MSLSLGMREPTSSAFFDTAMDAQISAAPPPYTTRLSVTKISHHAQSIMQRSLCLVNDLVVSDTRHGGLAILLLPRTKIVTAREFAVSSMTSILSLVVPNVNSRTMPARPSLSAVKSSKRGTMRPFVAIAMSWALDWICDATCLDLWPAHPSYRRKLILHQKVVCLVVETPLTDDQVRAGILDPRRQLRRTRHVHFDHI